MATSNVVQEDVNFSAILEAHLSSSGKVEFCNQESSSPSIVDLIHYYAVSLPEGAIRISFDTPPIYKNKFDAIKVIKKYPQSRFKQFLLFQDALQFVWFPFREASSSISSEEKKSAFKSLTSQQLVLLRKQIEAGNETKFLDMVWSNPHYLISTVDGPTILQEGSRHNAVHIAAKCKQTKLCMAILNTMSDFKFLRMLYPDDDLSKLQNRRKHILDLYLNMPDKPLCETPLHFASKFGANDIVEILLSYTDCDRKKCNKYNLLPEHIIYERCVRGDAYLKSKMQSMFEDAYYVPVLRGINNSVEPVFGEPCSAVFILKTVSDIPHLEEKLICSAFAGPMSHNDATNFYLAWKKKDFSNIIQCSAERLKKELRDISLSDPVKGLERIGRQLAKLLSTSWVEYWLPLDLWIDISSKNGLTILEHHLRYRVAMGEFLQLHHCDSALPPEKLLNLIEKGLIENLITVAVEEKEKMKEKNFQSFQVLIPYISCLTEYEFTCEEFIYYIHDEIAHLLYLKLNCAVKYEDLHQFIMHLNLSIDPIMKSQKLKFLLCIIEFMWFYHVSQFVDKLEKPVCACDWKQTAINYPSYFVSSSDFYNKLVEVRKKYFHREIKREESSSSFMLTDEDNEVFYTPPQSPSACYSKAEIFVNGFQLSESDIDIYRAIENVAVKKDQHPHVFFWKLHVESQLSGLLKEDSVLSRTPASASATIKRCLLQERKKIQDNKSLRKTLF